MKKHEIPTPALVVDYDKLCANIDEMAARAQKAGIVLRPHIKTHKTPIISHMQVQAGAVGITCAKVGEAEVMAEAGIQDIWVAYPLISQEKIDRLVNLARWVQNIRNTVDTYQAIRSLNATAQAAGVRIDVMVEVEAGYRRTGVMPDQRLVEFVKEIVNNCPALHYTGLMYMAGGTCKSADPKEQAAGEMAGAKVATDAAALLRKYDIETEVVSGGSTPGSKYMHMLEGVNEYRPGCYVFGDLRYAELGAHTVDEMSATVLTTVVSVPEVAEPDHFIVDAGSKTVTHTPADTFPGFGTISQMRELCINVASEEHGAVHLPAGMKPPAMGTKLDILPNYVSDVVNLFDDLYVVKGDDVIGSWKILARGKRV